MKHIILILGVVALIAFASCSKKLSLKPMSFSVATASTNYHVGDNIIFNFTGNPDIISFYSGLPGNTYDTATLISNNIAVPIKNFTQVLSSYNFKYTSAGTYKVFFVATNATVNEQNSITQEIDLTVQ